MTKVAWFEVMGSDLAASQRFYSAVLGWTAKEMPGMPYAVVDVEEGQVGGGIGQVPGASWSTFYLSVDDVEQTLAKATAEGGSVLMPPRTLPNGDRIAVFADPDGHPIGLVKDASA